MNAWYETIEKPPLTPPNWIFGPVWTVLYIMIAASLVLYVRNARKNNIPVPYIIIVVHLISNAIWTPLFFTAQSPAIALIDIVLLDTTLVYLVIHFWSRYRISAYLLLPYLCWVSFATYLNVGFVLVN